MDIVKNTFLRPTPKFDDQKFEFVFLLDHSGSMYGQPIELAKASLKFILQSLPSTCYFNIVGFNSSLYPFFATSVPYNDQTLSDAKQKIDAIRATGGTSILPALKFVFDSPPIPGYLMQIFSITDGQVENRTAVLELMKLYTKRCRSFSLGIGTSVDRQLVTGIAEAGGGIYEFVTYNEQFETKILRQLTTAQKPALLKPIRVNKILSC